MSVKEDIVIAKQVMQQDSLEKKLHTDSSSIYKSTNENMNDSKYIELLKDNKNILSVIGSGDQILNSILFDSYNIDAFDINRFAKYYLEFKISAIMTLSYEEYLSFFFENKTFKRNLYKKILDNMKGDAKEFWESIACYKKIMLSKNKYSPNDIYHSGLFISGMITETTAINNNPYLSKNNYYLLREKISKARIRYYKGDIFDLAKILDRPYDFINLSNICMYTNDFLSLINEKQSDKYKTFVRNLKLNSDGKVLSYLMGYIEGSTAFRYANRTLINDENYKIYIVKNKNHIDDALAVYKKTR